MGPAPVVPSPLPASEPYDCDAGYSNWEAGWSTDKKEWCCANKKMGCAAEAVSEPYDCDAGYSNWEAGWSPDKKECAAPTRRWGARARSLSERPCSATAHADCKWNLTFGNTYSESWHELMTMMGRIQRKLRRLGLLEGS